MEPQHYHASNGLWGILPDQSRNRLIFAGNGVKGAAIPLSDWGLEFAENLPEPILKVIREARGELRGSIEDEEYRKRLQDRFGDRWNKKVLVQAREKDRSLVPGTLTDEGVDVRDDLPPVGVRNLDTRQNKTIKVIRRKANLEGLDAGVERKAPVDVPKFGFATKDEFQKPWHLALWAPNDPDGPKVLINQDAEVLQAEIQYYQEQYPDHYAERIAETVRSVFGEIRLTDEPLPPRMRPPGHVEYRVLSEQFHDGIKVVTIERIEQPRQKPVDVDLTISHALVPLGSCSTRPPASHRSRPTRSPDPPSAATTAGSSGRGPWQS